MIISQAVGGFVRGDFGWGEEGLIGRSHWGVDERRILLRPSKRHQSITHPSLSLISLSHISLISLSSYICYFLSQFHSHLIIIFLTTVISLFLLLFYFIIFPFFFLLKKNIYNFFNSLFCLCYCLVFSFALLASKQHQQQQ